MRQFFILFFTVLTFTVSSQELFTITLKPSTLTCAPKLHSGAYGTYNNKWFFIGGRKNGLHGFQPPFAFEVNHVNDSIFIVDPTLNQAWGVDVYSLPDSIREPITSSNMEFYLQDSMMYMVGGYGWKETQQNFITWPTLTAVNIKGLMNAVMNQQPITPYFRQIQDSVLAVCGSHLQKLDSTYYLVFGHRFDGTYNISDTAGFFVQEYTNEVRKFSIWDRGDSLAIYNYTAVRDTDNFRRRDYNLIPQISAFKGTICLAAFSGVFRKGTLLPYLNLVEIYDTGYIVRNNFNQQLNQYHTAYCLLYDSISMLQHNIFFGGISMYYIDTLSGIKVADSMMPFVRTISDVVRTVDETYAEFAAEERMPALLGTNAYFFRDIDAPVYREHFIHLNALPAHRKLGYLLGGIETPEANISQTDPSLSFASPRVFEVVLDRVTGIAPEPIGNYVLNFSCYPNPANSTTDIQFELNEPQNVKLELLDMQGRQVAEVCNKLLNAGKQQLRLDISKYPNGVYNCVINVKNQRKSIRFVKD